MWWKGTNKNDSTEDDELSKLEKGTLYEPLLEVQNAAKIAAKAPTQHISSIYNNLGENSHELITAALQLGLLLLFCVGLKSMSSKENEALGAVISVLLIKSMMKNTSTPVANFIKAMQPYTPKILIGKTQEDPYNACLTEYKTFESMLSSEQKKAFSTILVKLKKAALITDQPKFTTQVERLLEHFHIIKTLLIPNTEEQRKVPPKSKQEAIDEFELLIKNFKEPDKQKLRAQMLAPLLATVYEGKNVPFMFPYLYGEAGTGKSKFIHDVCTIFNIPCHEPELSTFIPNSPAYDHKRDLEEQYLDLVSAAILKARETNSKTVVIFLDELPLALQTNPPKSQDAKKDKKKAKEKSENDKDEDDSPKIKAGKPPAGAALVAYLLKLLGDRKMDHRQDTYLSCPIPNDIKIIFAGAGNAPLASLSATPQENALSSRFTNIETPGLQVDEKFAVVWQDLQSTAQKQGLTLPDTAQDLLRDIIQQHENAGGLRQVINDAEFIAYYNVLGNAVAGTSLGPIFKKS